MWLFKKNIIPEDIIKRINKKERFRKYFFLIVGCFLLALSFNMFFEPNNLVAVGMSGVAIVIQNVFGISSVKFLMVSYILLLILSYFTLGKEETKNSLIGSILYPLFVFLTQNINNYVDFNVTDMLLIALFGAILYGIGSGLTFKYGYSTGGTDIICQIVSKYFKISIGDAMQIVNIIIILASGFFLGSNGAIYAWENVMYAIITIYIISLLNNKVLLRISGSKAFYVITEHETDVKNFLIRELGKGVTVLDGHGGYTGDRKKVIMCAIPTKQYFLAKAGILEIDKDAIILINDVYQSSGIE